MERDEIEKILSEAGWNPTKGAPSDLIDWQCYKPYNRIILWPIDFPTITPQDLEYKMSAPPERRRGH